MTRARSEIKIATYVERKKQKTYQIFHEWEKLNDKELTELQNSR